LSDEVSCGIVACANLHYALSFGASALAADRLPVMNPSISLEPLRKAHAALASALEKTVQAPDDEFRNLVMAEHEIVQAPT
jgi:hypothetical protein